MRKIYALILFSALSFAAFGQDLVILHTNDIHSNIETLTTGTDAGLGGYQRIANYVRTIRENHPNVLLLDAGDYNQGTPYYTLFKGKMEIELLNAIGYDATTLGNHEFDDGQQILADRLRENAKYVTLCANYDFSDSPLSTVIKPYTIIEKGGKKIGIIGATLDLNGFVAGQHRQSIRYNQPIPIINKLARQLKDKYKCDLVILLSHMGFQKGTDQKPGDILIAEKSANIDIIIGGHTHTLLKEAVIVSNSKGSPVVITQTGTKGMYVGRIDINF